MSFPRLPTLSRRTALAWAPVLVAVLLAAATGWGVSALRQRADQARQIQFTVAEVHIELEVPQGLLDQASRSGRGIVAPPPPPGSRGAPPPGAPPPPPVAARVAETTVLPRLTAIEDSASKPADVDVVIARLRALADLLERSTRATPQRTQLMQQAELAFDRLEGDQAHAASTASRTADVATLVLIGLAALAVVLLLRRFDRVRRRDADRYTSELRALTLQDALTRLANRRRLEQDLADAVARATLADPVTLVMFDLDGFKGYNDTFGHGGGDELLQRVSRRLQQTAEPHGTAYRLGGDEFCVLLGASAGPDAPAACREALGEHGEGYAITASAGVVRIPAEATNPSAALQLADQRMYAQKPAGRGAARRRSSAGPPPAAAGAPGVALAEVAALVAAVAAGLGIEGADLRELVLAAELREGPLPAAIHERFDGSGYPAGLAGEEIPLGSRILHVCDAYAAITSPRPYRATPLTPAQALGELRRCAGSQFDPRVVAALDDVLGGTPVAAPAA